MKVNVFLVTGVLVARLWAGPHAPAAGQAGTTAVALDDVAIEQWATGVSSYTPGADVDAQWRNTSEGLGVAEGNFQSVVSLGRGGEMTLTFDSPVANRPGPDFAVFENGFSATFLELAFVEVSSDGVNFVRFESLSETVSPVGPFGSLDPTNVDGLAGKYKLGFGTPFDLSDLPVTTGLDLSAITHLRLLDVVGGTSQDSLGRIIYDPFATTGSAGFDLDGVAVLNGLYEGLEITEVFHTGDSVSLTWECEHGASYRIETRNVLLNEWQEERIVTTSDVMHTEVLPLSEEGRGLMRVVQMASLP